MNLIWFLIKFVRRGSEFEIFPVKGLGWPIGQIVNDAGEGSECSSDKINFQAEMEEVIEVIVFAIYSG